MTCAADDLPAFTRHALGEIRARTPLVQCLTNAVVTNFTANVLLALGAAPAMVDIPQEAGPFAKAASGVLVNLGTPHGEQRAAMLEALSQDYVRVAKAKGLRARLIVLGHALPNALLPVVTLGGLAYANLLAGAVMTETVFSWPGLGRYTFRSAVTVDFPAIMAITAIVAAFKLR